MKKYWFYILAAVIFFGSFAWPTSDEHVENTHSSDAYLSSYPLDAGTALELSNASVSPETKDVSPETTIPSEIQHSNIEHTEKRRPRTEETKKAHSPSSDRVVTTSPQPTIETANKVIEAAVAAEINANSNPEESTSDTNTTGIDAFQSGDVITYGSIIAMVLATFGLFRVTRKRSKKLTRWAKANPLKSQLLIAGIHLPLLGLALMGGYNFRQLGYEMSEVSTWVFSGVTFLGFLSIPFVQKKTFITLPAQLNRYRAGYVAITLAGTMAVAGIGNRVVPEHPDNFLAQTVMAADQAIYGPSDTHTETETISTTSNETITASSTVSENRKARAASAGATCAVAVIVSLLLLIVVCAGGCLAIAGISAAAYGWAALGIAIVALSFFAIFKLIQLCVQESKKPIPMPDGVDESDI